MLERDFVEQDITRDEFLELAGSRDPLLPTNVPGLSPTMHFPEDREDLSEIERRAISGDVFSLDTMASIISRDIKRSQYFSSRTTLGEEE